MGSIGEVEPDYDVLVIGAGLSGCYACHRMHQLNLKVKVLEAGTSVGGTWYWNRYPGARFDSESYTYAFYFSPELLNEWKWTEHYAPQPETERYIRFLCDKLALWDDMQFNTSITKAYWIEQDRLWKLTDASGRTTPNWAIPLRNSKISPEEMEQIRTGYPQMLEKINQTRMGFMHSASTDSIWDSTPEMREAFWEELWALPGFPFWLSNYKEILIDEKANDLVTEFVARKIKERVHDPWTADKLVPKNHGFGTRRVPMETYYFEAYNRPNVRLVDLLETPIQRVTADGLQTTQEDFNFDMLIYATGFDAVTGAFDAIDFRGTHHISLRDEWKDGSKTYLGLTVEHFPNMFMSMGPHQAYGNIPRSIEFAVGWIAECIGYCQDRGISYIEATELGVQEWTDHVHDLGKNLLSNKVDSWMTGVNKNVAGKQKRIVARYMGAAPEFRAKCNEVAGAEYELFTKR
ncbi:hypothetical protein B0A55_01192 [Friedmanniomyces simplex]|uniref:FAD/NAD(P)-binding domain-containing protein n=1 Tax=Friedmanniomyces simplex TaxID=329884 RepID=A0A4U0Y365_9PEZI|nr:hypothetical protein B0A55_01192 [Friedmanniomyces simplex]